MVDGVFFLFVVGRFTSKLVSCLLEMENIGEGPFSCLGLGHCYALRIETNTHTHSRSGAISFIIWIARNDRLQNSNWRRSSHVLTENSIRSLSGSLSQLTTLCNFSTPTTWTVHESISLGLWLENGSNRKTIFHLCILTSVSYTYFKFSSPQIWMKSLFRTVYVFFLHSARLRDEEKWNFT